MGPDRAKLQKYNFFYYFRMMSSSAPPSAVLFKMKNNEVGVDLRIRGVSNRLSAYTTSIQV
jgi:hypothetical protein